MSKELAGTYINLPGRGYPTSESQTRMLLLGDIYGAEATFKLGTWKGQEPTDTVYFFNGTAYAGAYNFFGGMTEDVYNQLVRLSESNAVMYSLYWDFPNLGELAKKRIGNKSCYHKITPELCDAATEKIKTIKTISSNEIAEVNGRVAIGDSHHAAFAKRGSGSVLMKGKDLTWYNERRPVRKHSKRTDSQKHNIIVRFY